MSSRALRKAQREREERRRERETQEDEIDEDEDEPCGRKKYERRNIFMRSEVEGAVK